jgi:hypothetical protein
MIGRSRPCGDDGVFLMFFLPGLQLSCNAFEIARAITS